MFEIVMGIDDFLIQLVKYCTTSTARKLSPKRFMASSSYSGSIMEYSYLIHAMTLIILVIEMYRAHTPKSSGRYRWVKTGTAVLHQLDQKIIYPHYDFKHLTEKYFEIGMKLDDFLIQLVKY